MASSPAAPLAELSAKDATGEIREIYTSIEAALGVRLVNLVYRHMATVPSALEWAWSIVGPHFNDGRFSDASLPLVEYGRKSTLGSVGGSRIRLTDFGLMEKDAAGVVATLDAYNRANPMNALSLRVIARALDAGWKGGQGIVRIQSDEPLVDLLPMLPLDEISPTVMLKLRRLALLTTGNENGLVPSLFRHFTPWPDFLDSLGDWLETTLMETELAELSGGVNMRADSIAGDIFESLSETGNGPAAPDQETRAALASTIDIFLPAICRMIVIGSRFRRAIAN